MSLLSITQPITADAELSDYFYLYNVALVDASLGDITLTLPPLDHPGGNLSIIRIDASVHTVTLATSPLDNQPVNNQASLNLAPGFASSLVATNQGWWTY